MRLLAAALLVQLAHATQTTIAPSVLEAGDAPSSSVAIAITGLLRTLLSKPALQSFHTHVEMSSADVHIVIAEPIESSREARVRSEYKPFRFRTTAKLSANSELNLTCLQGGMNATGGHTPRGNLLQWFGLREVYHDIAQSEQERGAPYEWVVRLRTDTIFFDTIEVLLPTLSKDHVHFPAGGMSPFYNDRWTNDQLFICPRHLCRAYFEFAEIWQSPLCDPTGQAPVGIYATWTDDTRILVPNTLPTTNYSVPELPSGMMWEWYLLARYSPDGGVSLPDAQRLDDNFTSVGLASEFNIAYTISMGNETVGSMTCTEEMGQLAKYNWRNNSAYLSRVAQARTECTQMGATWGI
jgi:hypothetical protein